jgi:MinD-like ATPase involved in chromosome partitioning or flagellar assembly
MKSEDLARVLGRAPEHSIVSDGRLVVQANNEGVPFVLANPDAQVSLDVMAVASAIMKAPALAAVRR